MKVTDIATTSGIDSRDLLRWAGALEQASEHPVAVAIATRAVEELGQLPEVQSFVTTPGLGATGIVDGRHIAIGRPTHWRQRALLWRINGTNGNGKGARGAREL